MSDYSRKSSRKELAEILWLAALIIGGVIWIWSQQFAELDKIKEIISHFEIKLILTVALLTAVALLYISIQSKNVRRGEMI